MTLKNKIAYLFDMDGTINIGNKAFPAAIELFKKLHKMGKKVIVLTNNSSRTSKEHMAKLIDMGFQENTFSVYSSVDVTIEYLKEEHPKSRIYLLGTNSVKREFERNGIQISEESPDIAVLSFDTELTYEKLKRFCRFVREGAFYVATNPDINCPSEEGPIPDAGSLIAAVERSTGRVPDLVVGKPNPTMLHTLLEKLDLKPEDAVMIGDRLYTDIEMAKRAGIDAILVLSGETRKEDLKMPVQENPLVFESVESILKLL
ncbi:MAG TPA: HAD family hydrolase [Thermotogae bacterium]|nr:HAD family hydrolase [Thermotogota bacterium]